MKLKTNLFEQITQHFYEDGDDIHWWIDEEDEEGFLETHSDFLESGLKKTDTRVLSGKAWNDWWIGGVYGDYEGTFISEECPRCKHLLVEREEEIEETGEDVKVIHCSNHDSECGYRCDEFKRVQNLNDSYEKKPYVPEKQIRLAGETVFEFVERVGLQLDRKDKFVVLSDNYWTECCVCKETVPCSDFYIGQETGFATVFFSHDNCTNGGPSIGVPFKKETKEKWNGLLFGK